MKDATQINTAIPLVVLPRDEAPSACYLLAEVRRTYPFYGADEDVDDEERFDATDCVGFYWQVGNGFVLDSYAVDLINDAADYGNRGFLWVCLLDKATGKAVHRFHCEVPIDWLSPDSAIRARLYVVQGEVTMFSTLPLLAHREEATWKTTRID